MILNTIKIMPLIIGAVNTPILNTPKRADDNLLTFTGYINEQHGVNPPNTFANLIETPNGYINEYLVQTDVNQSYALNDDSYYINSYARFELRQLNQTYYKENSNGYSNILFQQDYKPMNITMLKVDNLVGQNKVIIDAPLELKYPFIPNGNEFKIKQEIYITYTNNEDLFRYDLTNNNVQDLYNEINNRFSIAKVYENTNEVTMNYTTSFTMNLGSTDDEYNLINSQTYYIFFTSYVEEREPITTSYEVEPPTGTMFFSRFSSGPSTQHYYNVKIQQFNTNIVATQEVIDVPGMMFEILTMPFTFISIAFNLTLFPNTPYSLNISNLFLVLIAILVFAMILKLIIGKKQ